ncbi:MAG: thiamine diphosphokinase [Pseudomonadota bacterium]
MQASENAATIATLLGAGPATIQTVRALYEKSSILAAVDGGVAHAAAAGLRPDIILGDLDSLPIPLPDSMQNVPKRHLTDQESTDFDKALRTIEARLYLCAGFTDGRIDHQLACFHSILKHPERQVILVSESDVVMLLPPQIALSLEAGTRVSVFPMKPGFARSVGLKWPLDGLALAPDSLVSTSNAALGGAIEISSDGPCCLLILPRQNLDVLVSAVLQSPPWPLTAA